MTREPMRLLNVKVPAALRALVEEAAAVSGAKDLSTWVREALQAGATTELEVHRRVTAASPEDAGSPTPPPSRPATLGVQRRSLRSVRVTRCVHPPTARFVGVTSETCTLCGHVVRSTL